MPFETMPIKLTAREFQTEIMVRHLVKEHKCKEYNLRKMPFHILKGYYELGKVIKGKYGKRRGP